MSQALQTCRALVCALSLFGSLANVVRGDCKDNFELSTFSYNNIWAVSQSWLDVGDSQILIAPGGTPTNSTDNVTHNGLGMGQVLYNKPVMLLDPQTNGTVSFSTSFSFTMNSNGQPPATTEGVAFIITSDEDLVDGIVPVDPRRIGPNYDIVKSAKSHMFAVQISRWDGSMQGSNTMEFPDQSTGNITTIPTNGSALVDADLADGSMAVSWIDYDSVTSVLQVRISNVTEKPEQTLFSEVYDLKDVLLPSMYIGFSSSISLKVHWWNFNCSCFASDLKTSGVPPSSSQQTGLGSWIPLKKSSSAGFPTGRNLYILISGVSVALLLTVMLLIFVCCKLCRSRRKPVSAPERVEYGPRIFLYKDLSLATNGFDSRKLLGKGGFGSVYKGTLRESGSLVAVKRIEPNNAQQGERQFIAEVSSIGRLQHQNLVKLQGWCHEKGELLLVYDYMPNGSLDRLLFGVQGHGRVLPWESRFNILKGVAAGLAYLHGEWEKQVVHRDVKASNVLLDANFNPRLGDFGLARLVDHNKKTKSTSIAGTYGYLAPEIKFTGKATDKTDVFSFGALVLEVTCGRRPIQKKLPPDEVNLVDWVWGLHGRGEIIYAVDSRLQRGSFDTRKVSNVLFVGLLCSHPDPTARPQMRQVVQMLNGEIPCPPVPKSKPLPFNPFPPTDDIAPATPTARGAQLMSKSSSRVADSGSDHFDHLLSGRSNATDSTTSLQSTGVDDRPLVTSESRSHLLDFHDHDRHEQV